MTYGRAQISELINSIFHCSKARNPSLFSLPVCHHNSLIRHYDPLLWCMNSEDLLVTVFETVNNLGTLSPTNCAEFNESIKDEIEFLLRDFVCPVLLHSPDVPPNAHLQPLKWIFNTKPRTHAQKPDRSRPCLFSASYRSALGHSVHGSAPTVSVSTIHTLAAIFPKCMALQSADDPSSILSKGYQSLSPEHTISKV